MITKGFKHVTSRWLQPLAVGEKRISTIGQLDTPIKGALISQVYHVFRIITMEYGLKSYPVIEMIPPVQKFMSTQRSLLTRILMWPFQMSKSLPLC